MSGFRFAFPRFSFKIFSVSVASAGSLNFKDAMLAFGKLSPDAVYGSALGIEFAGQVLPTPNQLFRSWPGVRCTDGHGVRMFNKLLNYMLRKCSMQLF